MSDKRKPFRIDFNSPAFERLHKAFRDAHLYGPSGADESEEKRLQRALRDASYGQPEKTMVPNGRKLRLQIDFNDPGLKRMQRALKDASDSKYGPYKETPSDIEYKLSTEVPYCLWCKWLKHPAYKRLYTCSNPIYDPTSQGLYTCKFNGEDECQQYEPSKFTKLVRLGGLRKPAARISHNLPKEISYCRWCNECPRYEPSKFTKLVRLVGLRKPITKAAK